MPDGPRIIATKPMGGTVPIRIKIVERSTSGRDGFPYNPSALTVAISGPAGTSVLSTTAMTFVDNGLYIYMWDTSALTETGNYLVTVTATADSRTFPEEAVVILE